MCRLLCPRCVIGAVACKLRRGTERTDVSCLPVSDVDCDVRESVVACGMDEMATRDVCQDFVEKRCYVVSYIDP